MNLSTLKMLSLLIPFGMATACDSEDTNPSPSAFTLNFKAMSGDLELNCDDIYTGLGPDGAYSVGVGDLRFYVSNLKFYDTNGGELSVTLDENNYQLNHEMGSVSLIDFTGRDSGFCEESQLGTPRTNTKITGIAGDDAIASVSFDVGVPQAVMKAVVADSVNLTDAPSPLAEMTWSWASGYKHIDMNFSLMDATHTEYVENSAFHIGSKDCGTANKVLGEQDTCGLINTPKVMINNFDPANNTVVIDIASMFTNTQDSDFTTMIMGPYGDDESICLTDMRHNGMCPIGMTFGTSCHSVASEAICGSIFPAFGLDMTTGAADSSNNNVFRKE